MVGVISLSLKILILLSNKNFTCFEVVSFEYHNLTIVDSKYKYKISILIISNKIIYSCINSFLRTFITLFYISILLIPPQDAHISFVTSLLNNQMYEFVCMRYPLARLCKEVSSYVQIPNFK